MGTKRGLRHKALLCLGALIIGFSLSACRTYSIPNEVRRVPEEAQAPGDNLDENTEGTSVRVYYLDKANQRVVAEEYPLKVFLNQLTYSRLFHYLRTRPTGEGLVNAIDPDTALLQANLKNNIIHLDVSPSFYDSEDLVAARVALVNTFTGLEGVDYVQITVEGEDLIYPEGDVAIGTMERYVDDLMEVQELDHAKLMEAGEIVERELYFRDIYGLYLLTEMRTIYLDDERSLSALLTEALTQGPLATKGLYAVLPGNVQVLDARTEGDAVTLYMSRSFIETQVVAGQPELSDLSIRVASLVLTVTALSDVASIKFYYEDGNGGFTDDPIGGIPFDQEMRAADFTWRIGRRIVVYFANQQGDSLVPEYRAVQSNNRAVEQAVLTELLEGPFRGNMEVIPPSLKQLGINVSSSEDSPVVTVDLPSGYDGSSLSSTLQRMLIYSIVNSLTDPLNLPSVNQVQFTVGGQVVDTFGSVDISRPLERNPSLIQQ